MRCHKQNGSENLCGGWQKTETCDIEVFPVQPGRKDLNSEVLAQQSKQGKLGGIADKEQRGGLTDLIAVMKGKEKSNMQGFVLC